VYLSWLSAVMLLEPSTAMYVFYMSIVVSVVMIINVVSYTANSIQEKILFALLNKTQIELNIGRKSSSSSEENGEEDGGNG